MVGFWSRVSVGGLLVLILLVTSGNCMCPLCTCPAFYEPVCASQMKKTGSGYKRVLRTFSQTCELNCQNKCLLEKFSHLHYGRCTTRETQALYSQRKKVTGLQIRKHPMYG